LFVAAVVGTALMKIGQAPTVVIAGAIEQDHAR
jgi:hypothetical protein